MINPLSAIPAPYKILGIVLVLGYAVFKIHSMGADSRQEEVDLGVKALAECHAAAKIQNDAVADLKAKGEAQDQKINLAQAKAAKMLRESQAKAQKREPVPQECEGAIAWGEVKINELTDRWNQ